MSIHPQDSLIDHTSLLRRLGIAAAMTGAIWLSRTDLLGSIMGGLFAALLLDYPFHLFKSKRVGTFMEQASWPLGFILLMLKVAVLHPDIPYSFDSFSEQHFQFGVGVACYFVAMASLALWLGRNDLLKHQMETEHAPQTAEVDPRQGTLTGAYAEVRVKGFLARNPTVRKLAKTVFLCAVFAWMGGLMYLVVTKHVPPHPIGQIQAIDRDKFCDARGCTLIITTPMGVFRMEPNEFKVGEEAHIKRTGWGGLQFCVHGECLHATLQYTTEELRAILEK